TKSSYGILCCEVSMSTKGPKARVTVSLDADTRRKLEAAVPPNQRSRYVERAIQDALRRDAVAALGEFLDDLLLPADGKETASEFIHRRRLELDGRPLSVLNGDDDAGDRRVRHRQAS